MRRRGGTPSDKAQHNLSDAEVTPGSRVVIGRQLEVLLEGHEFPY